MAINHPALLDCAADRDERRLQEHRERARRLRKRFKAREAFILPEIWDVVSARVIADAGFDVIGMSHDAIAWSHGLGPCDRVPLEALVRTAQNVARNFVVPVCADLEGILGRSDEDISAAVAAVVQAGCAGVVIGDGGRGGAHGLVPMQHMTRAVRLAKAAALEMGVAAVITARTEAFLIDKPPHSPFETAVERAQACFAAGADCISVPGAQHIQIVERLAANIDGPLCITVGLTPAPDLKAFSKAGAACIVLGSALKRSLLGLLRFKAEEILALGQFNTLEKAIPAASLNSLLS